MAPNNPGIRTYPRVKLRAALPSLWSSRKKTRLVEQVGHFAGEATQLHYEFSVLQHDFLANILNNQLAQYGYLTVPLGAVVTRQPTALFPFPSYDDFDIPPILLGPVPLAIPHIIPALPATTRPAQPDPINPFQLHYGFQREVLDCLLKSQFAGGILRQTYQSNVRACIRVPGSTMVDLQASTYSWQMFVEQVKGLRAGNLKTHLQAGVPAAIRVVLNDLRRVLFPHGQGAADFDMLAERTAAFLQPRFVKLAHYPLHAPALPYNAQHPTFTAPIGQAHRAQWLRVLQPIIQLLNSALLPHLPTFNSIPLAAPSMNYPTTRDIYDDAGHIHGWDDVMARDWRIGTRLFLFLRYAGRLHQHLCANALGVLPGNYKGIKLTPDKNEYRDERIPIDYKILASALLPALRRPRGGMYQFTEVDVAINRTPHLPNAPLRSAAVTGLTGDAQRAAFARFFPGMFGQTVTSPDTIRLCGLDNQLESIAIITDGQDLKIRVKMAPNVPAYVRQSRITRVEELVKIARHQNVPPPETTYPGTDSTGSLTSISRTPLLPAAVFHNPNRRLLGMDPGQVYQVAAVDAHLPEAHQAGAGTAAHVRLERGRHSLEATATAWSNRNERDARASDAARAVLLNRDSVDTMINHLRGLQIAREGCDIRLNAVYTAQKALVYGKLRAFYKRRVRATRRRRTVEVTRASQETRLARYVVGDITHAEFHAPGRPLHLKHPRRERALGSIRYALRVRFNRPVHLLKALVAFGFGQGNTWAGGHAAAAQLSLARLLAILGHTVVLVRERGTSTIAACSFQGDIWQNGAVQPQPNQHVHRVQTLERVVYKCQNAAHKTVKRRRRNNGHHGLQRHCQLADGTLAGLVSAHGVPEWRPTFRRQGCTYALCPHPPTLGQAHALDASLRAAPNANNPPGQLQVVFQRDANSGGLHLYILGHYILNDGQRPPFNVGPAEQPFVTIPAGTWAGYVAPDPNQPHTFVRI